MNTSQASSPVSRRTFLHASGGSVAAALAFPLVLTTSRTASASLILGKEDHQYELIHDWLTPPEGMVFGDTHGLAQDKSGRIYLAHTVNGASSRGEGVVVFDESGKYIEAWGEEFRGGAHGLDLNEEDGEEFLYHCDTARRKVMKTNLKGEHIWEIDNVDESGDYKDGKRWVPTNVAFRSNGDVYVGDGYGSSYIHQFDFAGDFIRTIARPGSGEGQVSCPHGLWVDKRSGEEKLVVADRSNHRIQYFSMKGDHLGFVTEGMRRPCDFDTRGDLLLVPDLDGVVTLLDKDNAVVASLGDGYPETKSMRGAPREQFPQGKFVHPHDAIFLHNGDILVAEWVPIGRVTLMRKVS